MKFMSESRELFNGKSIEISGKIICPVIQISTLKDIKEKISAVDIVPIAIIIKEDSDCYILSLTHDEIDLDEILEKFAF